VVCVAGVLYGVVEGVQLVVGVLRRVLVAVCGQVRRMCSLRSIMKLLVIFGQVHGLHTQPRHRVVTC